MAPIYKSFDNVNSSQFFHGDTIYHLYGKAKLNNLVSEIVYYPNCNHLIFNRKEDKLLPLNVKHIFFVLLASNIIKINIYTTIDNVVFSMGMKHYPTGALFMAIYDDSNWVNIETIPYRNIE